MRRARPGESGSVSQPGSGLFWSMVFGILVSGGSVRLFHTYKSQSYFLFLLSHFYSLRRMRLICFLAFVVS